MRKVSYVAVALFVATSSTPSSATKPDVSLATLMQLDDDLWDAGSNWPHVFKTLHPDQRDALLRMNAELRFVQTRTEIAALPPACEVVDCDETVPVVPPPEAQRPIEHEPVVVAPTPDFCDTAQVEVKGYTIFGRMVTRSVDWFDYCVDVNGRFSGYHHGHDAAAYGWGWEVGGCICIERALPPISGEEKAHEFESEQTFFRIIAIGEFGFTDTATHHTEGWVKANGPYEGQHWVVGW